jgi:adenosylcobinamide kinase/adenosylcobinamide-phosphate guanylyltransferase
VTPARATLVLGGQRSGKSRHAEGIVAASGLRPVYVATAPAGDAEMADRIARHRARRGPAWSLIEEPLDLPGAIVRAARSDTAVLVDCLTLWVSNLIGCHRIVAAEADRLLDAVARTVGRVVIVSNEVGSGIIPPNALARQFADDLGTVNQRVAAAVDEVVLLAAGLPLVLKRAGAGQ